MLLDLRGIIGVPGGEVPFDYEPDLTDMTAGSVIGFERPSRAAGSVCNRAGVLTFLANVDAVCTAVCARCLTEFKSPVHKRISTVIVEGEESENPDCYFLIGDKVCVDEIITTELILGMEERLLCDEDCAGLCQKCGVDLNKGSCTCERDVDPRLAALQQLLDD